MTDPLTGTASVSLRRVCSVLIGIFRFFAAVAFVNDQEFMDELVLAHVVKTLRRQPAEVLDFLRRHEFGDAFHEVALARAGLASDDRRKRLREFPAGGDEIGQLFVLLFADIADRLQIGGDSVEQVRRPEKGDGYSAVRRLSFHTARIVSSPLLRFSFSSVSSSGIRRFKSSSIFAAGSSSRCAAR